MRSALYRLQAADPGLPRCFGSYLLAEAIDRAGAGLAIHGHAHAGTERGVTAGGVRVRNVAPPVIMHTYQVYSFDGAAEDCARTAQRAASTSMAGEASGRV